MRISEHLLKAADLIQYFGHQPLSIGSMTEGFCVVGALESDLPQDAVILNHPTVQYLKAYLNKNYNLSSIFVWNFRSSKEHIISVLRDAANEQSFNE